MILRVNASSIMPSVDRCICVVAQFYLSDTFLACLYESINSPK